MTGNGTKILLGLVFLALVANFMAQMDVGRSATSSDLPLYVLFGAVTVLNLLAAAGGLGFALKALAKREKSLLKWGAIGFGASLLTVFLAASSPWWILADVDRHRAIADLSAGLLGYLFQNAIFAYAFYREYLRAVGTHPDGHRHRHRPPPGGEPPVEPSGPED